MSLASSSIPSHVPSRLVRNFNYINDPHLIADPWGFYDAMNDAPDIFFTPEFGGHWVVTRNDVADELLRRYDLFSTRETGIPGVPNTVLPNCLEPPEHVPYRKIMMQRIFSPKALASLDKDFRHFSRAAIDPVIDAGQCEFMATYGRPVPGDLFIKMMGLPPTTRDDFMRLVPAVFRGVTTEERQAAYTDAASLLSDWLDEKLSQPLNDDSGHIFTALVEGEVDGRRLLKEEMLSLSVQLMLAGLDTVTSSMSHIMHFLAVNGAHRQMLVDDPAVISEAVEELLRRFGISSLSRVAVSNFEFHGVSFKAGDMVLYSTPILSLDRRRFVDPQVVDFNRKDKKGHLAFATGPHLCAGHYLARQELRLMLEELLPRMPGLKLAPGAKLRYVSGAALALRELPLVWDR